LDALQQVPRILQSALRDAAEGRFRLPVENTQMEELRNEMRLANVRRDTAIAAGVLWLSGLIWLGLFTQYRWLGWVQMSAGIVLFIWYRFSKLRIE
jgi:hypothetical protein